ncbi:MAG: sn-glycerol-3-phosphate ABC transporter ATP-binding protein UgpC [Methylomonas sp.]|jgi:multiple sugar transport system ATP-binding protein|uniref:ABC transporter ATP-binding protein n=1 Tax=Methylomonas sp. TaxID=418 RepID=UPI0025EA5427|nr:sn-glycerol-3-phosphate ABC transporter ATP-binding protein UgpC [Methylomonas sp.]MCK9609394.1 sn-glycerol-3-phosphate ABC transporter ATP-binding protein UgpC [Methylomonas sp.]
MAEIVLNQVSKTFPDGTTPLKSASFTIQDGEFFILVGPSGCGKSTLLNLIVGLEQLSGGEIRVDGQLVNGLDPKDRNMAMVFQSYAIYPHMTVRENLAFPLKLAKLPQTEINHRVSQAADILELTALLDRKPASLSGGQRQRVAMGRAIVREPKAFLLDEPLSNLDARLRVQMRGEIARLQKRLGTTMLYVTHDQTEAMTLGDRVAVLHQGEVQQIGTPQTLYQQPANLFVAGFIGSPGMNLLPAQINGTRLMLPIGEIEPAQQPPQTGNQLIAGFRPEHLRYIEAGCESAADLVFEATAEVVEWLGAELFVHFDTHCPPAWLQTDWPAELSGKIHADGRLSCVARLDPAVSIKKGDRLLFALEAGKIQLFDRQTGCNLHNDSCNRD